MKHFIYHFINKLVEREGFVHCCGRMSSDHAVVSYRGINADAKYVVPIIRETKVRGEIHARDSEDTLIFTSLK